MDAALKILAVDDNPAITHSMRFIFAGPRYQVTGVQDGDYALAKLDANSEPYDVIIVDQKMPHRRGVSPGDQETRYRRQDHGVIGTPFARNPRSLRANGRACHPRQALRHSRPALGLGSPRRLIDR